MSWSLPCRGLLYRILAGRGYGLLCRAILPGKGEFRMSQCSSIAPMLSVRNGAKAVDFYKAAFGATELFRIDAGDGSVVARLAVGAGEFWVADESPEHKNFSPETLGGGTVRMI